MPLPLHLPRVQTSSLATLFLCPLEYGVSHFLEELHTPERPLVWLELGLQDKDDPIYLGNRLSETVNKVFETHLLQTFNYTYTLTLLQTLLGHIGPITLAVTQAHLAPEFASAVLKLQGKSCRVVLQAEVETFALPKNALTLTKDDLKLSQQAALNLANPNMKTQQVNQIWHDTDGAYDLFLSKLHQHYHLPPHVFPGPNGPRTLPGFAPASNPVSLLKVFKRKQRWLEALEVACEHFPEQVPEILTEAGHAYHEQGLHKRLFRLLEDLPEHLKQDEIVLYWRLQAAFRLGREANLRKEISIFLKENEAPELRAMAAGVFVPTNPKEALRAYKSKKTAFTAMQAGRLDDSRQSLRMLQASIALAEHEGKPYEIPRNASILANKCLTQGRYKEAAYWFAWALEQFETLNIKDGQRKLLILNDWVYTKLHTGELAGLEEILNQQLPLLSQAYPDLAFCFRETMGDFFLASSQPERALMYYDENAQAIPHRFLALNTLNRVRALIDLEQYSKAQELAERSLHLMQDENLRGKGEAYLAYGMILSFQDIERSRDYLLKAKDIFKKYSHAPRLAQAALYLAFTYMQEGKVKQTRNLIRNTDHHIQGLAESGLRLLSGPEKLFRPVWNLLWEEPVMLEIHLLGKQDVWLDGEYIRLFPQQLEILAILASRQRPMTLEELMVDIYQDDHPRASLKAAISKLRKVLPVISSHPYHITSSFRADFLEILKHLNAGDLKTALSMYNGPLLKHSESDHLRELDTIILESLRKAVLKQNDPELLLQLSTHLEDLEILEVTHPLLEHSDPRKLLIQTKIEQLQKAWLN